MNNAYSMAGKIAVVTGATGGLGAVICKKLAAAGAIVVVGYNNSKHEAEALADELPRESGQRHIAIALPVTDSAALNRGAAEISGRLFKVDVLVNCAGTTRYVAPTDLDGLDDELIDTILKTNVRGAFACVRAFQSTLMQSESALILNVSSVAAQTGIGSNIIYCASKAALDNMTKSLARSLAPRVRVLSISPGLVDTDFVKSMDPAWRNKQVALTPLGRLAAPEEIADAVIAAATLLRFSTGTTIAVEGGRLLN